MPMPESTEQTIAAIIKDKYVMVRGKDKKFIALRKQLGALVVDLLQSNNPLIGNEGTFICNALLQNIRNLKSFICSFIVYQKIYACSLELDPSFTEWIEENILNKIKLLQKNIWLIEPIIEPEDYERLLQEESKEEKSIPLCFSEPLRQIIKDEAVKLAKEAHSKAKGEANLLVTNNEAKKFTNYLQKTHEKDIFACLKDAAAVTIFSNPQKIPDQHLDVFKMHLIEKIKLRFNEIIHQLNQQLIKQFAETTPSKRISLLTELPEQKTQEFQRNIIS